MYLQHGLKRPADYIEGATFKKRLVDSFNHLSLSESNLKNKQQNQNSNEINNVNENENEIIDYMDINDSNTVFIPSIDDFLKDESDSESEKKNLQLQSLNKNDNDNLTLNILDNFILLKPIDLLNKKSLIKPTKENLRRKKFKKSKSSHNSILNKLSSSSPSTDNSDYDNESDYSYDDYGQYYYDEYIRQNWSMIIYKDPKEVIWDIIMNWLINTNNINNYDENNIHNYKINEINDDDDDDYSTNDMDIDMNIDVDMDIDIESNSNPIIEEPIDDQEQSTNFDYNQNQLQNNLYINDVSNVVEINDGDEEMVLD